MIIKRLKDCKQITALDGTRLRETLNPLNEESKLKLGYSIAHATIPPGSTTRPHRFFEASEVYYILQGSGTMYVDDESEEVGPGDTIYIPPGGVQYIKNTGEDDMSFLCIVYPPWFPDAEELVE